MVFHWSLSDNKSSQVSRTLLSIQVDLSNAVVWMVSTRALKSKSYSLFINPLVTAPSIIINIIYIYIYIYMRHVFWIFQSSSYGCMLNIFYGRGRFIKCYGQFLLISYLMSVAVQLELIVREDYYYIFFFCKLPFCSFLSWQYVVFFFVINVFVCIYVCIFCV